MSSFEVWAAGRPLSGVSPEVLVAKVQALFPKATPAQLARFTAGARFVVTRVPDEATAKRVVEALNKAGGAERVRRGNRSATCSIAAGCRTGQLTRDHHRYPAEPRPSRESTAINGTETTGTLEAQRRIRPSTTASELDRVKDRNGAGLVPYPGYRYRDGTGELASAAHGASASGGNTVH